MCWFNSLVCRTKHNCISYTLFWDTIADIINKIHDIWSKIDNECDYWYCEQLYSMIFLTNIWTWKSCSPDGCYDCSQLNETRTCAMWQGRLVTTSVKFTRPLALFRYQGRRMDTQLNAWDQEQSKQLRIVCIKKVVGRSVTYSHPLLTFSRKNFYPLFPKME